LKVLGLDVSTSNVGICVMDTEASQRHRVLVAMAIPLSKKKGLYVKSCEVRDVLEKLSLEHKVDVVVIEESLQAFRRNMSSARTICTLNRFNGVISWIARSIMDAPVVLGNVISVRNKVGLKIDRKSDINTKEQVLNWVSLHPDMINFSWPTKILKSGPSKGTERREDFCYDIADSFVVALWGCEHLNIEGLDPTII
tara:strand:+ start:234 stop:824 length:591 start_codon:yes stop_codon:yes gene_type:complete